MSFMFETCVTSQVYLDYCPCQQVKRLVVYTWVHPGYGCVHIICVTSFLSRGGRYYRNIGISRYPGRPIRYTDTFVKKRYIGN